LPDTDQISSATFRDSLIDAPNSERVAYVMDLATTAREEILMRVRQRDAILRLCLLSYAVLWALANGVELQAKSAGPKPEVVGFAAPIGLILSLLYAVEDLLIGRLSDFVSDLTWWEAKLRRSRDGIPNWESSRHLRSYAQGLPLFLRVAGQVVCFSVLPISMWQLQFSARPGSWVLFASGGALFVVLVGYAQRYRSGTPQWPKHVVVDVPDALESARRDIG
jgi:hypothetical protein